MFVEDLWSLQAGSVRLGLEERIICEGSNCDVSVCISTRTGVTGWGRTGVDLRLQLFQELWYLPCLQRMVESTRMDFKFMQH